MKKISDVSMICANNARAKAYISMMIDKEIQINKIYIMSKGERDSLSVDNMPSLENIYFNPNKSILSLIDQSGIDYEIIDTEDINDDIILNHVRETPEKYFIYSGFGGQILKKELFDQGKEFIHVHAGILPMYRGSTTAYYSLIDNDNCGATAIFLNSKIDEGDVIASKAFPRPAKDVDIDYVYEPWIRSQVLAMALTGYWEKGEFTRQAQGTEGANTYYVIHPVLKHIAMLG